MSVYFDFSYKLSPIYTLLFGLLAAFVSPGIMAHQGCSADQSIDETLPTGSRWEVCWEHRAEEGIVFKELYFTTPDGERRRVLKEAGLAQIHVAYDNGATPLNLTTDLQAGAGLGDSNLSNLRQSGCANGSLMAHSGKNVLCVQILRRGYAYKSYAVQLQGYMISIFSVSSVGPYAYVVRWNLYDDGSIEPAVGLSGRLPAVISDPRYGWLLDDLGRVAVGFTNHYTWRLDFDIGSDPANDVVEEFEVVPSSDRRTKSISVRPLFAEETRRANPVFKRSWRIRDSSEVNAEGRFISYHLEPLHTAHGNQGLPSAVWAANDVSFTVFKPCERFPIQNPTNGRCGESLMDFVDGEPIYSADIVLWYGTSYHHIPRSEDEPTIPVHWDGILIVPRDWTSTNPLAM